VIGIAVDIERADAQLGRLVPESRHRIVGGPLRQAAEVVAAEGNRRVHSPRGHARTFRVYVNGPKAKVTPGSRANFFSQRRYPILESTVQSTERKVNEIIHDAVESAVRVALR